MSKNTKKKNAIRFGAIAIAILIVGGAFSVWALSTQAEASGTIGEVMEDGIEVSPGDDDGTELLEDSVAGRPGTVNTPFELYTIDDTDALDGADYVAIVYLVNGAELMDEGMRYLTLDFEFNGQEQTLTLENGRVAFEFTEGDLNGEESVEITGGSYGSHPFAEFNEDVEFVIDVEGA